MGWKSNWNLSFCCAVVGSFLPLVYTHSQTCNFFFIWSAFMFFKCISKNSRRISDDSIGIWRRNCLEFSESFRLFGLPSWFDFPCLDNTMNTIFPLYSKHVTVDRKLPNRSIYPPQSSFIGVALLWRAWFHRLIELNWFRWLLAQIGNASLKFERESDVPYRKGRPISCRCRVNGANRLDFHTSSLNCNDWQGAPKRKRKKKGKDRDRKLLLMVDKSL